MNTGTALPLPDPAAAKPLTARRVLLQLAFYLPLMALIGVFSRAPAYRPLGPDEALLRLSIAHAAERLHPCRERSEAELAKMPPNMRAREDCPRERAPLAIELEIDGATVWRTEVTPAGVQRDGLATLYQRVPLRAGSHHLVVRMRDRPGAAFNHLLDQRIEVAAGDALIVDFDARRGGLGVRQ